MGSSSSRMIKWIEETNYALEVMANEDCGKRKHLRKGTWCTLHKVFPASEEAFAVTPSLLCDNNTTY